MSNRLKTNYLGIELNNPIVVASSSLTATVGRIQRCSQAGAGAVVVKSLFEEQIMAEIAQVEKNVNVYYDHPEAVDYVNQMGSSIKASDYLRLIEDGKNVSEIPVFASLNCISNDKWTNFAHDLANSGADGIELNLAILPMGIKKSTDKKSVEQRYFDIVAAVRAKVNLPIIAKIGPFFSDLPATIAGLEKAGANSVVLFNRFFQPDINTDKLELEAHNNFSHPEDVSFSLRWVALMKGQTKLEIAGGTGIHNGLAVAKQLLAGAQVTQVCSSLYLNGMDHLQTMKSDLERWMNQHSFETIESFRGKLSFDNMENPAAYERIQYIKALVGVD